MSDNQKNGLNLVKLCVGVSEIEDLVAWQKGRSKLFHTTRMVPKRADEIVAGGSLYWVIKGQIQARQLITAITPFKDDDGIRRCHLVLDRELVLTQWQPRRAFQGWRYLRAEDAPNDLPKGAQAQGAIPEEMRQDLQELGLL